MFNDKDNKEPKGFGADANLMLVCFLWAAHVLALPQLSFRKWRGSRADSIVTKMAAVAFLPVVYVLGGGGDGFMFLGIWGLLAMGTLSARGEKLAARHGVELSSRFIGIPVPQLILPSLGKTAYAVEPVLWLLLAGGLSLIHQKGLAFALTAGAVLMPIEYLIIARRDATLTQDTKDARVHAKDMAERVNDGGW